MDLVTREKLKELALPIDLKWKVSSTVNNGPIATHVVMIGYIDAREVQQRLDDVVGPENWQNDFYESHGKQFCRIGIKVNGDWVFKSDSGTPSATESEKGESSDAFKRAAVHWGINRAAYMMREVMLPCKIQNGRPCPVDESGNILKGQYLFDVCKTKAGAEETGIEYERPATPVEKAIARRIVQKNVAQKTAPKKKAKIKTILP